MNSRNRFVALVATVSMLMPVACGPAGGASKVAAAPQELEPQSRTVFGERLLLFLEFPHLVRGQEAKFLAHLSVMADGEPVRAGTVTLHIGESALTASAPKREGLFIPISSLPVAGSFPSRLVVQGPQATETLDLGPIEVHPDLAAARKAAEAEAGEPPPNSAPFLMEQQWKVKLLMARAGPVKLARRLVLPGQARIAEGREAVVSSPIGGRLVAPEASKIPRSGARVEAGQVLAYVDPPMGPGDAAQLQALLLDLELKALDVVRADEEAAARVRYAEREHERITKLRERGLSTQQDLEQAEQNLAVARSGAAAAGATRKSLGEATKARPSGQAATPGRFTLVAAISGIVVTTQRLEGESIAAGEEVFRVIDLDPMAVEGHLSEFDLQHVQADAQAVVTFAALPGQSFAPSRSPYVAPLIDPISRTMMLRYEVANTQQLVKAGMMAEVSIATGQIDAAVVIPVSAIVPDQGQPTAYVMVEGELFQRRDLELGLRDGDRVEVKKGLVAGEWVAARGAHVIRLASLSPASFGAGHQH